eukprot:gene20011-21972_t
MAAGTLYTYPDNFRAQKILIAAEYSGAKVNVSSDFELGTTNKSAEFLKKFPLGKVPAYEDAEGNCLYETSAIMYYVSDCNAHGANKLDACLVQQYMSFADNEILPSACAWTFPTLGLRPFNSREQEAAIANVKKCLELLNNALLTKTFLVGERVTLADISVCCNLVLLYKQVLDPQTRSAYGNVNRWFMTCINQPQFKKVLGEVKLCEKAAQFDAKMYEQLHPKQPKKGKSESKKQEKQPEKPKVEPQPAAPVEEKKKDPFGHLPPPKMVFDEWKKMYRNNDTFEVALPWLWENIDREGYSIWLAEYNYNEDLRMTFMGSNLVSGMFQRLEKLRKNCLSSMLIFGTTGNVSLSGVWMFRGQELAFDLCEDWQVDSPSFKFTKLDWDNEEHRKLMGEYLAQEEVGGKPVVDAKLFC